MPEDLKMTISLLPTGKVNVNFPQNPMVCAFLLHEAEKAIDKYFAEQGDKLVQPASVTEMPNKGGH